MDELPGDITRINPSYGMPTVFSYEFINNYESRGQFRVNIYDPDNIYLKDQELQLIHNPSEWRYWVSNLNLPHPSNEDYEQILKQESKTDPSYTFLLEPQEKITLLFRFFSLRVYDEELEQEKDWREILETKEFEYRQTHIV